MAFVVSPKSKATNNDVFLLTWAAGRAAATRGFSSGAGGAQVQLCIHFSDVGKHMSHPLPLIEVSDKGAAVMAAVSSWGAHGPRQETYQAVHAPVGPGGPQVVPSPLTPIPGKLMMVLGQGREDRVPCMEKATSQEVQCQPLPMPCRGPPSIGYRAVSRGCYLCWAWRYSGEAKL